VLNILEFELGILSSYHRFWCQNKTSYHMLGVYYRKR